MKKILIQTWNDIKNGENIDLYLTVFTSMIVGLLGLMNIVKLEMTISLTLAVLALLAFSSLQSRHKIVNVIKSQSELQFIFSDRSPISEERLRKAKTISHNGITLVGSSNIFLEVFKDCLSKGGKVRLIAVDPNSAAIGVAAQRFLKHQDSEKLKHEVQHSLENFSSRNIDVQLLKAMPPFSLWIIDENSPRAEVWLGLYPFRGKTEPWLKISPETNKEMFEFLQQQFENLWNVSKKSRSRQPRRLTHL